MTRRMTTMRPTLYFFGSLYPSPKNFRVVSQPLPNPIPRRKATAARAPQLRPLEYDPLPANGHFDPLAAEVGYGGAWVTPANPDLPQLWKRGLSKGAGLVNLGNTCFMNAVMQVLLFCPPVAALLAGRRPHCAPSPARVESCVLCALQSLAVVMLRRPGTAVAPYALTSLVRDVCHDFRPEQQQDAQEFMRGLLDAITMEEVAGCGALKAGVLLTREMEARSSVHRLFGGMLQSCVRCIACGHRSTRLEPFLDLSLEITGCDDVGLALRKFTSPERLDGENPYRCAGCNNMVNANKRLTIRRAPNVLVLHLKRFDSTGKKTKGFLRYPEVLGLGPFMPGRPDSPEPRYRLSSVLVHAGMSGAGHYYAFVHGSDGQWYCKDDKQTVKVPGETVMHQTAYLITYTRLPEPTAARPKPHSTESSSMKKTMQASPSAKGCRLSTTICVPGPKPATSLAPAPAPAPAPMTLGAIVAMYTTEPHSRPNFGSEITISDNHSEMDESSEGSSGSKATGRMRSILTRGSSAVRKVVNKVFGVEKRRQRTNSASSSPLEESAESAEPVTSSSVTEPRVKSGDGGASREPKCGPGRYQDWILLKRKRYQDDDDKKHERKQRNRSRARGRAHNKSPRVRYQSPFIYFTERRWRRARDSFEFERKYPDR